MATPHPHRREQILQEAQRLFVSEGIAQVTTRQIAQAVGISQPSLYAHFGSRDAIAVELCRRAFETLEARLVTVAASGGTPAQRLEQLCREYIEFGLAEESAYRVAFMLEMPSDGSSDHKVVVGAGIGAFAVLSDLMTELHGVHGNAVAQSTWASLHGLVSLLLARGEFPWIDRTELIERHVASVCRSALA